MFEIINNKKYKYWTQTEFVEEMKIFQQGRTFELMMRMAEKGLTPEQAILGIKQKQEPAYSTFMEFNRVGGDTFFQETFTCLSFVDFLGHSEVEGVAFPVKEDCPDDIHLDELKDYTENDSEYDFLIKKGGAMNKFQLKSAPEKYIKEFNSEYFIKDILGKTSKYADPEMVLVYLLQPAIERTDPEKFYGMIDEVSVGIGNDLPVKNIFFVGRIDLQTFEYTQVYQEIIRHHIDITKTLAAEVRNSKPFSLK